MKPLPFFVLALFALALLSSPVAADELARSKTCTATNEYGGGVCSNALHTGANSTSVVWTTNSGGSSSNITIDLNATYSYNITNVDWRGFDGTSTFGFTGLVAYTSTDGVTFTRQQTIAGNTAGYRVLNFTGTEARYVKLEVLGQFGDGVYGYSSWIGVYGTILTTPSENVTISDPTNSTFVAGTTNVAFQYVGSRAAADCWRYMDGSRVFHGTINNATTATASYAGLPYGSHNFTVICDPTTGATANATQSAFFTTQAFAFTGRAVEASAYEATRHFENVSFQIDPLNLTVINSTLWEGGVTVLNDSSSNLSFNFTVYTTDFHNLVAVNNTNHTENFEVWLKWKGNSSVFSVNDSSFVQAVIWGTYFLNESIVPTGPAENSPLLYSMGVANRSYATVTSTARFFGAGGLNASASMTRDAVEWWTGSITTPLLGVDSQLFIANVVLNVSYGSLSFLRNSTNVTINVSSYQLTNCSTGNAMLNFSFFDEDSFASMNATMYATFTTTTPDGAHTDTFNLSWVNTTVARVCVSPVGANLLVISNQEFFSNYALTYPKRQYFLANASLNDSTNIDLYLLRYLNAAGVQPVTQILLKNNAGTPQSGYTIVATRWYPALNQYLLVAMAQTDENGVTNMYLRPIDAQTRFFAYDFDEQVQAFSPQLISGSPLDSIFYVTLILTGQVLESYTTETLDVSATCSEVNGTGGMENVSCVYSDPSGSLSSIALRAYLLGILVNTTVCSDSSTQASGVLTCELGNMTNRLAFYWLEVGHSPAQSVTSGYAGPGGYDTTFNASKVGVFSSLAVFLVLVGVTAFSPATAVLASVFAIIFMWVVGLLQTGWPGLVGLLISAGILAYKLEGSRT